MFVLALISLSRRLSMMASEVCYSLARRGRRGCIFEARRRAACAFGRAAYRSAAGPLLRTSRAETPPRHGLRFYFVLKSINVRMAVGVAGSGVLCWCAEPVAGIVGVENVALL